MIPRAFSTIYKTERRHSKFQPCITPKKLTGKSMKLIFTYNFYRALESLDEEIRSLTGTGNNDTTTEESDWNKVEIVNP
jgi:hypothetical protein